MGIFDKLFGKKKKVCKIPESQLEISFDNMINKVASGKLGNQLSSNILIKKGESLILDIPGVSYCEERTVKFKGGTQGFSVRLMKGVSYRFGSFEGGVEKKVVPLDSGNFTLTSKRLIFSGNTKSVEYPLNKIVSITPLDNGVMINKSGKTKMEYFLNTTNLSVSITIIPDEGDDFEQDTVKYEMTGFELKKIIEKIIQTS